MEQVLENWREIVTRWAADHPVRMDYLLAGVAAVAGLWLLVTIIRLLSPKSKAETSAVESSSAPSERADKVEKKVNIDKKTDGPIELAPVAVKSEDEKSALEEITTEPDISIEDVVQDAVEADHANPPHNPAVQPDEGSRLVVEPDPSPANDHARPRDILERLSSNAPEEAPLVDYTNIAGAIPPVATEPVQEPSPAPPPNDVPDSSEDETGSDGELNLELEELPSDETIAEGLDSFDDDLDFELNDEDEGLGLVDPPLDGIDDDLFDASPLDPSDPGASDASLHAPANDDLVDDPLAEAEDDAAFDAALGDLKRQYEEREPPAADRDLDEILPDLEPPEDEVDISVFTPARVQEDQAFIVQAIFHVLEDTELAAETASMIDPGAQKRLTKTLRHAVRQGQILTAVLDIPEGDIDQTTQSFVWRGDIEPLQFIVTLPHLPDNLSALAKLQILLDGTPVASAVWRIVVSPDADVPNEDGVFIPVMRYRKAFVSYSSKDRVEVLKRVQGLQAAGMDVFQDVLDLEPGERWANALYRHIDDADAFFLFWSEASAESEWVAKEWRYALERAHTHPDRRPDICPVILTAPPPPPPAELADKHFNDILAYVVKAHETR